MRLWAAFGVLMVQPTIGYRLLGGDGPIFDIYAAARYTPLETF